MYRERFFNLIDKPYELFVKYKLAWPVLIGIFVYFLYTVTTKESRIAGNIIEDPVTYSMEWRSPSREEIVSIGQLMIKSNVSGCGEYYLKAVQNNEYVIACTPDGHNWNYYVSWPKQNKLYSANEEMLEKLTPPY